MKNIRMKLIEKIKTDTGIVINTDEKLYRPTLSWTHKTAGRFIWYFYPSTGLCAGKQIGSCENMTELLTSERIICDFGESHWGFYGLSSS